jgi:hypothetical protein
MSDERPQEVPKQEKQETSNIQEGNQILDSQTLENLAAFLSRDQEENKNENNEPDTPAEETKYRNFACI